MIIKFSYPHSKLFHMSSPVQFAILLQIIKTDYSDLTQELKDYDTDYGQYPLPKKGPCLLLIFKRNGGIFTTIRDPKGFEKYNNAVGHMFQIDLSYATPENK